MAFIVPLVAVPAEALAFGKYSLGGVSALETEATALALLIAVAGRALSEPGRGRRSDLLRAGANLPLLLLLGRARSIGNPDRLCVTVGPGSRGSAAEAAAMASQFGGHAGRPNRLHRRRNEGGAYQLKGEIH